METKRIDSIVAILSNASCYRTGSSFRRFGFLPSAVVTLELASQANECKWWCFSELSFHFAGVPDPPTNLIISSNCSNRTTTLSWKTGAANKAPITQFLIERKATFKEFPDSAFQVIAEVNDPSAVSFSLEKLAGAATLHFRMRAVNRFGPSRVSLPTTSLCRTKGDGKYSEHSMNPIEFGSCSDRKNLHNVIGISGQLNFLQWNVVTDQNVFFITAMWLETVSDRNTRN